MNPPTQPTFSIVTPSFNQGQYIGETIESVLQQDYPDYEHIVVDGGSTDQTLGILGQYPHLRVLSEPDDGHADALNKGFAMANGRILAFLNADDTLQPGALSRVAQFFQEHLDVRVAMGRCRFIDSDGQYTGIEHPSYFVGHRRLLEIWKGHGIPQPSVFWDRQVWENCGPMDVALPFAWIDYDFFCRVAKHYRFEAINSILSNYRLHDSSKTTGVDEAQRLEECIEISRQYWGPIWSPSRWQLQVSLWLFRVNRKNTGRQKLKVARSEWKRGRRAKALALAASGGLLAPGVAFRTVIYPPFRNRILDRIASRAHSSGSSSKEKPLDPQTKAMLERKQVWGDGWVGPELLHTIELVPGVSSLTLNGWTDVLTLGGPLKLTLQLGSGRDQVMVVSTTGSFRAKIVVGNLRQRGKVDLRVTADKFFVPDRVQRNGDLRPLSWKLESIETDATLD